MDLGKRIYELRKEKKLTREKLGKVIGTSGAIIGRYERNERTPSVEIVPKMAQALNENNERIEFYTNKLDSVFKNMEHKIINENYKNFIPRADFPFVF